jgi:hypothetical protein
MSEEYSRYARITYRLALGVSSMEDDESQELAQILQRRVLESIASACAPLVTSDLLSRRVIQATDALSEHGIALQVTDAGIAVGACFCGSSVCEHPRALLRRLLGAEVEPAAGQDGRRVLRVLGVLDAARYT